LSEPASVAFRSFDGLYIHGFLFKPPGFTPTGKYPALVQVHGGGHNLIMNGFNPVEQFLAQQGYVVLAINYRGSSGYGRRFQDLAIGDWGGKQALDAAAAGEFLKQQPFSNGKVGIYGGSYGGITTLAAITQSPDTFAAAVPMRGIYDFATAWEEADRVGKIFIQRGHRGTPAQNPAAYARSSSLARVDRIRTPVLVMHGGRDVRAPARQHVLLVNALRKHGKLFEEAVYADEAHGFSRKSQMDMYGRLLAWFDKYLD
jgi:dipeptidyl aminopeptidase/acylaminoacyl peptidase